MTTVLQEGTLFVRTLRGRFGKFNIGKLNCPLGTFVIKDKLIEEYDEGRYDGTFEIAKIYLADRKIDDAGTVIELRARLQSITPFSTSDLPQDEEVGVHEKDPIEEEETAPAEPPAKKSNLLRRPLGKKRRQREAEPKADQGSDVGDDEGAALFGHDWPIGDEVRIDPTADRGTMRKQIGFLKALGYRFDSSNQVWLKSS